MMTGSPNGRGTVALLCIHSNTSQSDCWNCQYWNFPTISVYGTHPKKWHQPSKCFSECTFMAQLHCKIGRLLPRIGWLLLKKWKDCCKECRFCTHISFWNTVQLRLWIIHSCVSVFWIFVSSNKSGFHKHVIFLDVP